jgi:hypothetical protein
MWKKLKLSSNGRDSGSKKCKRGYGGAYGGTWQSLHLVGLWSLESGGQFCVGAFGMNLASVNMKMFSHLIYFINKFDKFCASNVICRNNVAINCINVQHKRRSFLSTLLRHTMLVPFMRRFIQAH